MSRVHGVPAVWQARGSARARVESASLGLRAAACAPSRVTGRGSVEGGPFLGPEGQGRRPGGRGGAPAGRTGQFAEGGDASRREGTEHAERSLPPRPLQLGWKSGLVRRVPPCRLCPVTPARVDCTLPSPGGPGVTPVRRQPGRSPRGNPSSFPGPQPSQRPLGSGGSGGGPGGVRSPVSPTRGTPPRARAGGGGPASSPRTHRPGGRLALGGPGGPAWRTRPTRARAPQASPGPSDRRPSGAQGSRDVSIRMRKVTVCWPRGGSEPSARPSAWRVAKAEVRAPCPQGVCLDAPRPQVGRPGRARGTPPPERHAGPQAPFLCFSDPIPASHQLMGLHPRSAVPAL